MKKNKNDEYADSLTGIVGNVIDLAATFFKDEAEVLVDKHVRKKKIENKGDSHDTM
jgi:hypothetical protein